MRKFFTIACLVLFPLSIRAEIPAAKEPAAPPAKSIGQANENKKEPAAPPAKSIGQAKENKKAEMIYSDFLAAVKAGKVASVILYGEKIVGKSADGGEFEVKISPVFLISSRLMQLLEDKNVKVEAGAEKDGLGFARIIDIFGTLLWITILILIFRNMRGGDKMGMLKSGGRVVPKTMPRVTFDDVLGIDDAKLEITEVVDFLKDPERFTRIGAKIPKGVLLVGPPGTGKTLLARAVAGEAGVPFFSISGSDFVEVFVGVGASRVRQLFEQAKKNTPCLVFIDEIDAVGRRRGAGYGGGNDEREQTLNQLLVEMDGFAPNAGIIIVAATNRADVLDGALLRPGRFDRQVYIDMPDLKGRAAILGRYIREVQILSDVDVNAVARGTPGFSGAELANLVNEAALIATRNNHKKITQGDFDSARDKILMGAENRNKTMSKEEIRNTAYHEAGHAVCSVLLPGLDPIHKATIIPRGGTLGMVQHLPERDKVSETITEIKSSIAAAMAGRVAEEVFSGEANVTTGASGDIQNATRLARRAATMAGLDAKLGLVFYGETASPYGETIPRANISDKTAELIDERVKHMIDEGYNTARDIITKNRAKVEAVARALIELETLTGDEVRAIVAGKEVSLSKKDSGKTKAIIRKRTVPV
ncbi:MAG: ATP-dependent zinc metalloprotease FtsH [Rickettsiales bacterium]|jgi:cell division protease FtsH|nr:ATP-dependent zinc metalloprotease FtsH [Rickettsiales bacterium]